MKRGAIDLSVGTIILIVLGVVVLIALILGFTRAFSYFFDQTDQLPTELESAVQVCKAAAEQSLITSYCYQFRELDEDTFVNCEYSTIKTVLSEQYDVDTSSISCNAQTVEAEAVRFCEDKNADTEIITSTGSKTCGEY